jgi:REP element-mobilizing transposase RayT
MNSESFARSAAHSRGEAAWFVTWGTKYKYKTLAKPELREACEAALRSAASACGVELLELSVMSEHVHAIFACSHLVHVEDVARRMKGSSAHALFELEPRFHLRYPRGHFWARGYYARGVGPTDLDSARAYVRASWNDAAQQKLA